jgi:hypothetical protein
MSDTLSGDDSELKTTWDEICAQVQYEHSIFWETYDEIVRGRGSRIHRRIAEAREGGDMAADQCWQRLGL